MGSENDVTDFVKWICKQDSDQESPELIALHKTYMNRITALEEALRVMAESIVKIGFADQCEPHCDTHSSVEGRPCSCGGERRYKRKTAALRNNPIAAEAVRKAGG